MLRLKGRKKRREFGGCNDLYDLYTENLLAFLSLSKVKWDDETVGFLT